MRRFPYTDLRSKHTVRQDNSYKRTCETFGVCAATQALPRRESSNPYLIANSQWLLCFTNGLVLGSVSWSPAKFRTLVLITLSPMRGRMIVHERLSHYGSSYLPGTFCIRFGIPATWTVGILIMMDKLGEIATRVAHLRVRSRRVSSMLLWWDLISHSDVV